MEIHRPSSCGPLAESVVRIQFRNVMADPRSAGPGPANVGLVRTKSGPADIPLQITPEKL
jgi:hypothetical protein